MSELTDRKLAEREAEILEELQYRKASRDLITYAQTVLPFYRPSWHHYEIAEKLMAVEAGEIDRLLIVIPPRHGKSLLASVIFPGWYMGRHPTREIIAWSYGGELVSGFGARLRNIMNSDEHKRVFGEESWLSTQTRARDRWTTRAGGVYRAAGSGGAITGFGAHLMLIDDPVKGIEEALSKYIQDKTWQTYLNDVYTRLMKGSALVNIQTRWVEDDLAGRMLEAMASDEGDTFEVLHIPATRDKVTGKPVDPTHPNAAALWPDEYPIESLQRIQKTVFPTTWQSLYQGNPLPEMGNFFKRDTIRTYSEVPRLDLMRIYGASDYAVTHDDGDYTVHLVVGVDANDNLFVLDMWREQASSEVWVETLLDLADRWKPLLWFEEGGQIRKGVGPLINKRQRERSIYFAREDLASSRDKPTRAQSIRGRMALGMVQFPAKAPWWPDMLDEILKFPMGKNDDMVDTLSLIGRGLDWLVKGKEPLGKQEAPAGLIVGRRSGIPAGMRGITLGEIVSITREENRARRLENV